MKILKSMPFLKKKYQKFSQELCQGNIDAIVQFIAHKKQLIDIPDRSGMTLLKWAAYWGKLSSISLLLENGANPNAGDALNPLIWASGLIDEHAVTRSECIRLLLKYGADANAKNRYRTPVLLLTCQHKSNQLEDAQQLLEHGAQPNMGDDDNYTPLYEAARNVDVPLCKLLLAYDADPTIKNYRKKNARDQAEDILPQEKSRELVALLSNEGIKKIKQEIREKLLQKKWELSSQCRYTQSELSRLQNFMYSNTEILEISSLLAMQRT